MQGQSSLGRDSRLRFQRPPRPLQKPHPLAGTVDFNPLIDGQVGQCRGQVGVGLAWRSQGCYVERFIDAIVAGAGWTPDELCRGDFTGDGSIDPGDIPGFVGCLFQ